MPSQRDSQGQARVGLIAAVVMALAVVGVLAAIAQEDGDDGSATTTTSARPTTTTTSANTSTSRPTTSSPTTTTPVDASSAVWPSMASARRYSDPVAAARGFAVDFVGFRDPVVSEFRPGDPRSGEVEIRPIPSATVPVTTVFVRQLGPDDTWWVLGSATSEIVVDEPEAGEQIRSPVRVSGRARAFEGTVDVEVRQDDRREPLGEGFVTGSGGPELGPFEGEIAFSRPAQRYGAVVFTSEGGEDSRIWEASVVRVRFAS